MLRRPGFHTSEWIVAVVTALGTLANASQHWVTWQQSLPAIAAAIAYIVSRGLAKNEPRA